MDDFRVKKAGEILSRFFDEKTLRSATQFESFRASWKNIVGQRLADHSKPKSILRRTLLISADHAGWIQLLQIDQERILQRIAKNFPELEITSLAFTVEEAASEAKQSPQVQSPLVESLPSQPEPDAAHARKASKAALPAPLKEIFARLQRPRGD
ncbi:MAG: DUF721 domain-containing protein [Spirochaetota bacterium]|uniref:DUF721 domain-containing protein n=1 Tax=Rectinema subterraneum TaxID=2653714 RepID=UPI00131E28D3|nr:DUF721 domain-containing protein [Rectinema subterraneum]